MHRILFALAALFSLQASLGCSAEIGWTSADSEHFRVSCFDQTSPVVFGRRCEAPLSELSRKWQGEAAVNWAVRCHVVFHPSEARYLQAVGAEGRQTRGCSSVKITQGRVVSRRIDLRGDWGDPLREALPHELTHVLLADLFADRTLPKWADEGIAVLADTADKQSRHRADLQTALRDHTWIPLSQLLASTTYPGNAQRAAFYGESASLVEFLAARKSPATFLTFVRQGTELGFDGALRQNYEIDDANQLERLWQSYAIRSVVASISTKSTGSESR